MTPERPRRAATRSLAILTLCLAAGCGPAQPPNLVLVTLDTTRADHLGPYGYAGARTPSLDAFAERAVVYERAYATSSWTLPSHASLFTGLLPMQHGAQAAAGGPSEVLGYGVRGLSADFTTLAERLRSAGYRTGAVIGGPALRHELGLAQGFEVYQDDLDGPYDKLIGKRAQVVADRAIALVERFGREPFFLFVNFYDPHAPYRPPAPHDRGLPKAQAGRVAEAMIGRLADGTTTPLTEEERAALATLTVGYDAEIAYMDTELGRLLDALERGPRGEATLVAITADHGESFGEHFYLSHGAHLYEDNVRVPLLIRYPGDAGAGTRVAGPVQNHGLFALLLETAGLEPPDGPGVAHLDGGAAIVTEVRRSDQNVRAFGSHFDRDLRAIYAGPDKLIESSNGRVELFDVVADPQESYELTAAEPQRSAELRLRLDQLTRALPPLFDPDARAELTEETEEALRALGYIP